MLPVYLRTCECTRWENLQQNQSMKRHTSHATTRCTETSTRQTKQHSHADSHTQLSLCPNAERHSRSRSSTLPQSGNQEAQPGTTGTRAMQQSTNHEATQPHLRHTHIVIKHALQQETGNIASIGKGSGIWRDTAYRQSHPARHSLQATGAGMTQHCNHNLRHTHT